MNLEAESTTYKEYGTLRLAKEAKSTGYKNVWTCKKWVHPEKENRDETLKSHILCDRYKALLVSLWSGGWACRLEIQWMMIIGHS